MRTRGIGDIQSSGIIGCIGDIQGLGIIGSIDDVEGLGDIKGTGLAADVAAAESSADIELIADVE